MAREKRSQTIEPDSKDQPQQTSPLVRNVLTFLAVLGVLVLLGVIVLVKPVVVLVLVSMVLATGLAPAVVWLQNLRLPRKRRFPRGAAILLVYLAAIIVAVAAVTAVAVPVVQESIKFSEKLPSYLTSLQDWLADLHGRYSYIPDYAGLVERAKAQLGSAGQYIISSAGAVLGFFGGVISAISVIVLTYYMLATYESMHDGFLSLFPPKHRKQADQTLSRMASAMGGWLRGQLILAGIVGLTTAVVMWVMGIPYPFLIGVVGAVAELVPMLGPFAAAVPAVLITMFGPTWKLVASLLFFAVLAQVEGNYLAPRIMQKQVGLSPLVTIIALLAGATLLGVVGALLAIPIAAALQVLYVEVGAPAIRSWGNRKSGG